MACVGPHTTVGTKECGKPRESSCLISVMRLIGPMAAYQLV
jgi:hypothetical protein